MCASFEDIVRLTLDLTSFGLEETGGGKNSTRVDNYMYNYHRRLNDLDLRVARECEIERIQEARLTSKSQKRFDHNDIL